MNKIFLLFVFFYVNSSLSQAILLETNLDARSIAMGESFIANTGGLIPADNNPALLTGNDRPSCFFSRRNLNWINSMQDDYFYSAGASFKTKIGYFAFMYKRQNMGQFYFTHSDISQENANYYEHAFIISYANKFSDNLSIGLNIKTFTQVEDAPASNTDIPEYNTSFLFDLGLTYKIAGFSKSDVFRDNFNLGAEIQNYGTDYKSTYYDQETIIKLPRYFRLGFAYQLDLLSPDSSDFFKFTFTGEYRNMLNNYYYSNTPKDYWGAGFEAMFYDLLAFRIGGISNPFSNIYGLKGVPGLRYGFGLNLPLSRIGISCPLKFVFDYSFIPLRFIYDYGDNQQSNLDAFNLQLILDI